MSLKKGEWEKLLEAVLEDQLSWSPTAWYIDGKP